MSENDKVRLQVDIDYKLAKKLDKIPWGLKSDVIRKILTQLADRMDKDGSVRVVYLLMDNKIDPLTELTEGKEL